MQANPDKFQAIAIGKKTEIFLLNWAEMKEIVKLKVQLLEVTIDFKINFTCHISHIYRKSSHQFNVLKGIGQHL